MCKTLFSTLLIFVFINLNSQADLEIIKHKNQDRSVDVWVNNSSQDSYILDVNLDLQNMKTEKPYASKVSVPSDTEVFICSLVPTSESSSYQVNFKAYSTDKPQLSGPPRIIFYSKNSQKESTQIRNFLQKHDIPYQEYNVSYNKKTKATFKNMLAKNGLDKKEVELPVLVIDDEIHYNFKNVKSFLKNTLNH